MYVCASVRDCGRVRAERERHRTHYQAWSQHSANGTFPISFHFVSFHFYNFVRSLYTQNKIPHEHHIIPHDRCTHFVYICELAMVLRSLHATSQFSLPQTHSFMRECLLILPPPPPPCIWDGITLRLGHTHTTFLCASNLYNIYFILWFLLLLSFHENKFYAII